MANLKDTIVLGNLTVTGKITGAIDSSGGKNTVAQDYDDTSTNLHPLLFSAVAGATSTNSRGNATTLLNNSIGVYPHSGTIYGSIVSATSHLQTSGYISVYDDEDLYPGADNFNGGDVDTFYYAKGISVGDIYTYSFPAMSGTFVVSNSAPTFSSIMLTEGTPLFLTGTGSGTYNKAVLYCNPAEGFVLENPRVSDSNTAAEIPFTISKRGGGGGTLKLDKIQGVTYPSVTLTATANGWAVPMSDTYGCIYPDCPGNSSTGYGYLGHAQKRWHYLYAQYIGTSSHPTGAGYFTSLYKNGSAVSTSDVRLKNSITNTTLEALPIINKLHILNYQLNSFSQEQEKLKRQKEKARITMAQLPKTKENRKLRKELQKIISTPNRSNYRDIGVSAQELEELLPSPYKATFIRKEATSKYSDQRYIYDDNLVYLAIKAIQEQQTIIDTQQQQIQTLEDRLQHLEARVIGDA